LVSKKIKIVTSNFIKLHIFNLLFNLLVYILSTINSSIIIN